jgi:hypothetical protein
VRGDEGTIPMSAVPRLVLQPADLSPAFLPLEEGRQGPNAWRAWYRRLGSERTDGPIGVDSRAKALDSSDAADDDLEAARADFDDWQPIGEPGLGDESFAGTRVGSDVRYYQVHWREDNVTATLALNGVEGRFPFSDALELARRQEQRIANQR